MEILEIISEIMKDNIDISEVNSSKESGLIIKSQFSKDRASEADIKLLNLVIPEDILKFWQVTKSARLYEDINYGQWGLLILSPANALNETETFAKERGLNFIKGDLIIGKFLGDSELLLIRTDDSKEDYGNIIVELPLDPRKEWYYVEKSFTSFLINYSKHKGNKYWEIV